MPVARLSLPAWLVTIRYYLVLAYNNNNNNRTLLGNCAAIYNVDCSLSFFHSVDMKQSLDCMIIKI